MSWGASNQRLGQIVSQFLTPAVHTSASTQPLAGFSKVNVKSVAMSTDSKTDALLTPLGKASSTPLSAKTTQPQLRLQSNVASDLSTPRAMDSSMAVKRGRDIADEDFFDDVDVDNLVTPPLPSLITQLMSVERRPVVTSSPFPPQPSVLVIQRGL